MHRRTWLRTATAAAVPLVAGCTGGGQQQAGGGGGSGTVEMVDKSFDPLQASVESGGTVTWKNRDDFGHDVTSAQFSDGAASWDFEQSVDPGESVSRTFDSKGFYEYYCSIHGKETMCGVVLVGGVSYGGSLPCSGGGGGGGGGY